MFALPQTSTEAEGIFLSDVPAFTTFPPADKSLRFSAEDVKRLSSFVPCQLQQKPIEDKLQNNLHLINHNPPSSKSFDSVNLRRGILQLLNSL